MFFLLAFYSFVPILRQALNLSVHHLAYFFSILLCQEDARLDHVIADLHAVVGLEVEIEFNRLVLLMCRLFTSELALIGNFEPELNHAFLQ